MDDIEAVFNRKDMTFEEAVQYFKLSLIHICGAAHRKPRPERHL